MRKCSPGRPKKIDPNVVKVAKLWLENDLSMNETMEQLNIYETIDNKKITSGMVRYAARKLEVIDHGKN